MSAGWCRRLSGELQKFLANHVDRAFLDRHRDSLNSPACCSATSLVDRVIVVPSKVPLGITPDAAERSRLSGPSLACSNREPRDVPTTRFASNGSEGKSGPLVLRHAIVFNNAPPHLTEKNPAVARQPSDCSSTAVTRCLGTATPKGTRDVLR